MVKVHEIVIGATMNDIFIVMEFVEHDLKELLESITQPMLQSEVKCLMIQLLRGVAHLHDNWILHRDLKTSNLLLSHKVDRRAPLSNIWSTSDLVVLSRQQYSFQGILKIADFGLAREYGSPLKPYTQLVVTLW